MHAVAERIQTFSASSSTVTAPMDATINPCGDVDKKTVGGKIRILETSLKHLPDVSVVLLCATEHSYRNRGYEENDKCRQAL